MNANGKVVFLIESDLPKAATPPADRYFIMGATVDHVSKYIKIVNTVEKHLLVIYKIIVVTGFWTIALNCRE